VEASGCRETFRRRSKPVASLAYIARLHANEAGSGGRHRGAIAQQAEDVANQLESLAKQLEEICEEFAAHE
jgi:hypothetical protein